MPVPIKEYGRCFFNCSLIESIWFCYFIWTFLYQIFIGVRYFIHEYVFHLSHFIKFNINETRHAKYIVTTILNNCYPKLEVLYLHTFFFKDYSESQNSLMNKDTIFEVNCNKCKHPNLLTAYWYICTWNPIKVIISYTN